MPSWSEALDPYLGDRWRLAPLTVNYRTPAEVMAVAADVLAAIDPELEPPRSVRRVRPPAVAAASAARASSAQTRRAGRGARLAEQAGEGKLAVIVPAALAGELGAAVSAALPGTAIGADPDLTSPVVVLTVRQAKGLEFDCVLIADPARLLAESPRGLNDLYVALTRATQQVGVVHHGEAAGRARRQPQPAAAEPAAARSAAASATRRRHRAGRCR